MGVGIAHSLNREMTARFEASTDISGTAGSVLQLTATYHLPNRPMSEDDTDVS